MRAKSKKTDQNLTGFIGSMLTGIASRSAPTSRVHRLYRDGNTTEEEFRAAIKKDANELLAAQDNFAYVSYGQLDWLDLFRPMAKSFKGFAARTSSGEDAVGPVTRWFRTNTFYRKPLVNSKINCNGNELADAVPASAKPAVIFLPAPYSFSKMVENSFYGTAADLAMDYSIAIAKSIPKLQERGYKCILLLDHFVGYEQSRKSFKAPDWYEKTLSSAKIGDVKVGVHYPSADAAAAVSLAANSSLDFIGVDAIFGDGAGIDTGKDLLIGAMDGARVGVESPGSISASVEGILDKASFSGKFYIGPRDRLYDVPFDVALQKIAILSRIKGT